MKKLAVLISAMLIMSSAFSQLPEMKERDTGAAIKASYLYNFAKNIDWPDKEKTGNFVISVMGGNSLYQELVNNYNSKQIGSQQIEIRKLSKTLNISKCHVLYVSQECQELLPEISKALNGHSTLIISDGPYALTNGAIISFISDKEKRSWLFELNETGAEQRKLYIGTTLKSLARKVQ